MIVLSVLVPYINTSDTSLDGPTRQNHGLTALLPPCQESYALQLERYQQQLLGKTSDLEKYCYLSTLRQRQPDSFYRLLLSDIGTYTKLIYTPVVGLACQNWSKIYMHPEGLYVPITAKGHLHELISQWPNDVSPCPLNLGIHRCCEGWK